MARIHCGRNLTSTPQFINFNVKHYRVLNSMMNFQKETLYFQVKSTKVRSVSITTILRELV